LRSITEIDFVIVVFNSLEYLDSLLMSIGENCSNFDYQIIIVNNGINDLEFDFQKYAMNINILNPSENLGFGRANNLATKNGNSEILCFLNPDILIKEDIFTPIIDTIIRNQNVGACAPCLCFENGDVQYSYGFSMGFIYEVLEAFGLIKIWRKIYELKVNRYNCDKSSKVSVGWVSGACFMVRRSVFESVGGFSKEFFLNYEDIDLCYKLEMAGYKNFLFPAQVCIHYDHSSFANDYAKLVFTRYESRLIFSKLNYGLFMRIIIRCLHILGIMLRLLIIIFSKDSSEKEGRFKGYMKSLYLYIGLPLKCSLK